MTDKGVILYVKAEFSLTWNSFFQIPHWPNILGSWARLDREDTLRLQRDSTRETTETQPERLQRLNQRDYRERLNHRETQPETAVTRQRINQRETSFQRLDTGSRETRQRTKRELSYGDTSL